MARVTLGFFIKHKLGKSQALRHTTCACSGLLRLTLACWSGTGHSFTLRVTRHFVCLGWRSLRAGGLVACSHPKSPSDKTQSKLAATLGNNKVSNRSKSKKRDGTPEILLSSFPPTRHLLTQALCPLGPFSDPGQDKGCFAVIHLQLMEEDDLMDNPGVHFVFLHPSPLVHYFMPWNILLGSLFSEVRVTFTALCQSAGFQGDFFAELPSFAFPVTRAGTLRKDNFIPVYYGEGHVHLQLIWQETAWQLFYRVLHWNSKRESLLACMGHIYILNKRAITYIVTSLVCTQLSASLCQGLAPSQAHGWYNLAQPRRLPGSCSNSHQGRNEV